MKQDNLFDELLDDDGAQVPINDEFSDLEQLLNVETVDDNEDDDENNKKEPDEEKDETTEEKTEEGYKFEESESINRILESKGINPHEILYEDENGEEIKVDFYNLDPEEQLNLLHYNPSSYDLEDNEIEAVNFLRENNISLEDYTEYVKNLAIEEFKNTSAGYNVDQYSDEELYVNLLKDQYPNLTEEEIGLELEKEKTNEALFNKKASQIREYYKAQEDSLKQEEIQKSTEKEQLELQQTQTNLANAAVDTKELMGFDIEDNDRRETFNFIFNKDVSGKSDFFKALEDPQVLFRAALFVLKEEEINKTLEAEFKKSQNNNKPPIIKSPSIQQTSKVSVKGSSSKPSQQQTSSKLSVDDLYHDLLK